jgi:hypothetical protein
VSQWRRAALARARGGLDMVPVTAIYAGLLGTLVLVLGFDVGRTRLRTGVSLLEGGNKELAVAIRRHANFIENVPLALLLMALAELNGTSAPVLHGLGVALVAARIAHPFGLDFDQVRHPLRGIGAGVTSLVILVLSILLLWKAFAG